MNRYLYKQKKIWQENVTIMRDLSGKQKTKTGIKEFIEEEGKGLKL